MDPYVPATPTKGVACSLAELCDLVQDLRTCAVLAPFADFVHRVMELKENTTIIVLGASGDLAKKKTVGASLKHA